MKRIAESYVKLVLALGQHDPDYVDTYYGPLEYRIEVEAQGRRPLADIRSEAVELISDLQAGHPQEPVPGADPEARWTRLRQDFLIRQLQSLAARVDQLSGRRMTFDEESQALYDAVAPRYDETHFQRSLDQLDATLPGEGPVVDQLDRFLQSFLIQRERLDVVFRAAIAECRRRTAEHIELSPGESFEVEYVTGKPWSGFNLYKGGYHSLIQVNTDLPIYIDRAVDLASHEGYPGHHVHNMRLERRFVRGLGWPELSIHPLFSPQSLIAEGAASFGTEVVFPGQERVAWEQEKLFPLAGLDPARTERYYAVQELARKLSYAGNEAARRYLDGAITREQAVTWMRQYALYPKDRAEQRIRFVERYRSYVINYNWGLDLVKESVERQGGTPDRPGKRWEVFGELLSAPRMPSGLREPFAGAC
jgi:hypothetical protein